MKIKTIVISGFMTNCYLIFNDDTKEGIIIDPASPDQEITDKITEFGITPKGILLTHGHGDHTGGVEFLREKYDIQLYASLEEVQLLKEPSINLSSMFGEGLSLKPNVELLDGQILNLAGFNIKVMHTPGHTSGSCCYYFQDYGVLFSGDTIFYGSYGRTDFPTGSTSKLMHSIKEKILTLPTDTIIYSGHGPQTTVGDETKWY